MDTEIVDFLRGVADVLAELHAGIGPHNCTADCPDVSKWQSQAVRLADEIESHRLTPRN